MHVLFYINSLVAGGAERVLSKLASHCAEAGLTVTVVTQKTVDTDHYTLHPNITRYSTESGNTARHLLHGVINNLRRITRLRALIRSEQPDCVVAFMNTANTVATLAALGTGVPVIISERNYPPTKQMSWLRERVQRLAHKWARTLVVQTERTRAWYEKHERLHHIEVIPNGISLPLPRVLPHVMPEEHVPHDKRVLLCVGRLDAQKQPAVAVEVFQQAQLEEDWLLVWIGRGDSTLLPGYNEGKLAGRVVWLPAVGNIQDWYERADVYMSTSAHEGFPNSLLEAMACGCPSLAFDCPTGPAEIIQDGHNGILVPADHVADMVQALRKVTSDPELRDQLAANAPAVMDDFSDEQVHDQWRKLFNTCANRSQSPYSTRD